VRNTSQEEWSDGVVASIEPLQVKVTGWLWSSTDKYYMIRKKECQQQEKKIQQQVQQVQKEKEELEQKLKQIEHRLEQRKLQKIEKQQFE